jgi:hypothetical protein
MQARTRRFAEFNIYVRHYRNEHSYSSPCYTNHSQRQCRHSYRFDPALEEENLKTLLDRVSVKSAWKLQTTCQIPLEENPLQTVFRIPPVLFAENFDIMYYKLASLIFCGWKKSRSSLNAAWALKAHQARLAPR